MLLSFRSLFAAMWIFGTLASRAQAYVDEVQKAVVPISPYKPTYFLLGEPSTKIQLSFKGRLVDAIPFYLGYSQLMFWELFQISSPFRDTNYDPDFFCRIVSPKDDKSWLDLGLFEHESNGKEGDDSRSWNRAYLRYSTAWKEIENLQMELSVKVWFPYGYSENPDIANYRGLAEFSFSVSGLLNSIFERDDLLLRLYFGGATYLNPLQGGQELTLRAKFGSQGFLPLFVLQLFHGYGESLLDYQENRTGLRVGIGF